MTDPEAVATTQERCYPSAPVSDWVEVHYMNKDGYALAAPSREDAVTVAPDERYTVRIHATEPGTWVWHCHILPTPTTSTACSPWSQRWSSTDEERRSRPIG
jgi:FtsP/CotA-like multicopper oxidase with cupredoxin domain